MKLTNEQLSALPERKEYIGQQKLIPYKISGDDVIMFHDKDGTWAVDYHLEGGPYKRRFSL